MPVEELNRISNVIIGAAIEIHRVLGPGLSESAYRQCLAWELRRHEVSVDEQVAFSIRYKEL
jgi:GxxExxY protein